MTSHRIYGCSSTHHSFRVGAGLGALAAAAADADGAAAASVKLGVGDGGMFASVSEFALMLAWLEGLSTVLGGGGGGGGEGD